MTERLPKNLKALADEFGGRAVIENIFSGESVIVDGVEFVSGYIPESSADRFYILKPMHLVDRYRELAERARGGNIVELGIAEGGSAALLALWADPAKLVTVDNEPVPLAALDEFAEARGLQDRLRPFYGVDQADRATLTEIIEQEFGDGLIDLVIDDASHLYGPTRASFETIFPFVKPGGRYVIEDWEADIAMADAVRIALQDPTSAHHTRAKEALQGTPKPDAAAANMHARTSMARLVMEIVILAGGQSGLVADVSINKSFISVTRGDAPVAPGELHLDKLGVNGHNLLKPPVD